MTRIMLFHSVLGVRPGVLAAAEVFRAAGHQVTVIDQFNGRVFDDYDEASAFAEQIGYPALISSAKSAVGAEPEPFVAAGFSNGAGMAEIVTATKGGTAGGVLGSLQFAGALPLQMFELTNWPANTPAQLHYSTSDPFRNEDWVTSFAGSVTASGSPLEMYLDYPGAGHLFTDRTLPDEYDETSTELCFERSLEFLDRLGRG